jgi:aspartate ammonia-lyase
MSPSSVRSSDRRPSDRAGPAFSGIACRRAQGAQILSRSQHAHPGGAAMSKLPPAQPSRIENGPPGGFGIPPDAYWDAHTWRSLQMFSITGCPIGCWPEFVRALAHVKKAAALANERVGALDSRRCDAIVRACDEVAAGELDAEFVVDVIHGGDGSCCNMNANEVIANRALELLGHPKRCYGTLHPINHVNCSQGHADVISTAARLAVWNDVKGLLVEMAGLRRAFERKATEFSSVLKIGRIQLQDALPMSLGQEFLSFALMVGEGEARLREVRTLIQEINLGAPSIGTFIDAAPGFRAQIVSVLAEVSGVPVARSINLLEATQDTGAFVELSGVLKRIACKLSKSCHDLSLLSSGPRAGFGDIVLPPWPAGAAELHGRSPPGIPEAVNQVAYEVIGNDVTITMANEAGQLQLNAFEPIMGWSLFKSILHLTKACRTLAANCVDGIRASTELLERRVVESVSSTAGLSTAPGCRSASRSARQMLADDGRHAARSGNARAARPPPSEP